MIQCFYSNTKRKKNATVAAKTKIFLAGNKCEQATVKAQPGHPAKFHRYHIYTVYEI